MAWRALQVIFVTIGYKSEFSAGVAICKIICLHLYRYSFTSMNNRLQQFLELENLTPAKLADTIGVQRSGLSHILSGRNKPSYDFITRLLAKFPRINSDWLLTGKGKPYKDFEGADFSGSPLPSGHPSGHPYGYPSGQNGNFQNGRNGTYNNVQYNNVPYSNVPYNGVQYPNVQSMGVPYNNVLSGDSPILESFEEDSLEFSTADTLPNSPNSTDNEQVSSNFNPSQPSENGVKAQNRTSDGKKKRIKRVIIFYNDGSFEELFPHIR